MLPAESENDALTDGRTEGQTDGRTDRRTDTRTQIFEWRLEHNTPQFFKWRGIKISRILRVKLKCNVTDNMMDPNNFYKHQYV